MTKDEALKLALEALEYHTAQTRPIHQTSEAITAIKEALAQPEQEPVAWEQFYPDIGKPQIERPKVRTGDCLLVGVCASEGHKIQKAQPKQEPVYTHPVKEQDCYGDGNVYRGVRSKDSEVQTIYFNSVKELTDEEIISEWIANERNYYNFARAILIKAQKK